MFLDDVIAAKHEEVRAWKARMPLAGFRDSLPRSGRSLGAAIGKKGLRYILECKRSSPSKGVIRRDYDPAAIARSYRGAADAISVLTDGPHFGGSLDDLKAVSGATDLPVLRKDFIVDEYQVYQSRLFCADAVLLMMSVIASDEVYKSCMCAAESLGMDVLTEVRNEEEARRAVSLGARIIGINNRDLATLRVDTTATGRLSRMVPRDRLVVSESGIKTRADAQRLAPFADALLVGTAMMQERDTGFAARSLVFGRVKACGLKTREGAESALCAGAVFGGLIFAQRSPRKVTVDEARKIREGIDLRWAGVFSDQSAGEVATAVRDLGLSVVQLHGTETPSYICELKRLLGGGVEVWKAIGVEGAVPEIGGTGADRVLLDTKVSGASGGTGVAFDWRLLEGMAGIESVVLAGGIGPGNVREALGAGVYAVDVNSGVEASPGVKDPALLRELFENARGRGRGDSDDG